MKKTVILFLSLFLLITLSACTADEPTLKGESVISLEVGETYEELGTTQSGDVTIDGSVNTSIVGTYEIVYSYEYKNEDKDFTRTIHITDSTNPVIILTGGNVTIEVNDSFIEPGYSASDAYDGNITSEVDVTSTIDNSTIGSYSIIYYVVDSSLNSFTTYRTVTVVAANQAPTITLLGDNPTELIVGDTWTDSGATATDNEDGNITSTILVTGDTVNTSIAGTYYINYDVIDSDSLPATTIVRTVIVNEPNQAPVITLIDDGIIYLDVGETWIDPGATAMDNEDGNISSTITLSGDTVNTATAATYTVLYDVVDSDGLSAITVSRTVTVNIVNLVPVITISYPVVSVLLGTSYVDEYTANDPEDGDITNDVLVSGNVDIDNLGIYQLEYTVSDSEGLAAITVIKEVHVVEMIVDTISHIYIQQGITVDLNSAFADISATPLNTLPVIDTSILGVTIIETDLGFVKVKIYNPLDNETIFYPGSVIYFNGDAQYYWIEGKLSLPKGVKIKFAIESNNNAELEVYGYEEHELATLKVESSKSEIIAYSSSGLYYIEFHTSSKTEISRVQIDLLELVDFSNEVFVDIDKPIVFNNGVSIQEFDFEVIDSGQYEINFSVYDMVVVELFDELGNLIFIKYNSNHEDVGHIGNFAVGTYHVRVTQTERLNSVRILIDSERVHNNFSPSTAYEIIPNTATSLSFFKDRNWYYIDIVEEGLYNFRDISTTSWYNVDLFNEDLLKVSTGYNAEFAYLEVGKHFLRFNYDSGAGDFIISKIEPAITLNNTLLTALPITIGETEHVYFDLNNLYKWYTFTLTEESILHFNLNASLYDCGLFTLLKDGNAFFYDEYEQTIKLDAGVYTLYMHGRPHNFADLMINEIEAADYSNDRYNPSEIALDFSDTVYIENGGFNYYEFTITETELVNIKSTGYADYNFRLINNLDELLLDSYLDSWIGDYQELEAGTYIVEIYDNYPSGAGTYTLEIGTGNTPPSIYSTDFDNPLLYDPNIRQIHYAFSTDSVYQELTFTEPYLLDGYIDNVEELIVWFNGNQIHSADDEDDMFPFVFLEGTYIIEMVPSRIGIIGYEDFTLKPLNEAKGTIDLPTELDLFTSFYMASNPNSNMDVYTINVLEDNVYSLDIDSYESSSFYILDGNDIVLSSSGVTKYVYLEAGTYTLITNSIGTYYYFEVYVSSNWLSGDSFSTAKEIYFLGNSQSIVRYGQDNYYKFDVSNDAVLEFNYNCSGTYEIYDNTETLYDDNLFVEGTYFIKFVPSNSYYSASVYTNCPIEVSNNSAYIVNNTMETAIDLYSGIYYEIDVIDPMQRVWFKLELPFNGIIEKHQSNGADFDLYNELGELMEFDIDTYVLLSQGTYYIEAIPNNYHFNLEIRLHAYTDLNDDFTSALDINLEKQYSFSSFSEDDEDMDYFHFTLTEDTILYIEVMSVYFELYDNSHTHIRTVYGHNYQMIEAGEYYLETNHYNFDDYSFSINRRNDLFAPTSFGEAKLIPLEKYVRGFSYDPTKGYFKFNVTQDMILEYNTNLTIYDSNEVEFTDTIFTPGTYYAVYYDDMSSDYVYGFHITIDQIMDEDEDEVALDLDNTYLTPESISIFHSYYYYYSQEESDTDYFIFTIGTGSYYYMEFYGEPYVQIYDSFDQIIYAGDTDETYIFLDAGTYILDVTGIFDDEYAMYFDKIDIKDISIDINEPTMFSIYEMFTGIAIDTDPQYLTFTLHNDYVLYNDYLYGVTAKIYSDSTYTTLVNEINQSPLYLNAGTYYVEILATKDFSNYYFNFNIKEAKWYSTDSNTAETITITDSLENYYFYVDGINNSYATFTIENDSVLDIYCDHLCTLLDDTLTEYTEDILIAGTYYIEFSNDESATQYLWIQDITPFIYDSVIPTTIELGEKVVGYSDSDTYISLFDFTITEATYVRFDYQREGDIEFVIKTILGEELYSDSCTNYYNCSLDGIMLQPDTYLIEVSMNIEYYIFRLVKDVYFDNGGDETTPIAITLPYSQTSMIRGKDDIDVYSINMTDMMEIDISVDDPSLTITVFDPNGVEITESGGYYYFLGYSNPGEYKIFITGQDYNTEYTIEILATD